jgi:hypothetical protein
MQPDLDVVAKTFFGRVDLMMVSAAEELEMVRRLGVRATPTLIGVKEGREVFRIVGRRSRKDLVELFEAIGQGGPVPRVSPQDVVVALSAGSALLGIGLASGPVWPLVVLGTAVLIYGMTSLLWARRG